MDRIAGSLYPDRSAARPLHRQLAQALREAILHGDLPAGTRILASRALAVQLGVSRNTVTQAVDQLVAEGYLATRTGAGTFVVGGLARASAPVGLAQLPLAPTAERALDAARGRQIGEDGSPTAFRPGLPALDAFPVALWKRVANRAFNDARALDYGDPRGFEPLRVAIAAHLRQTRGTTLGAENVVIVEGTQAALALAGSVLVAPGETVLCEDPGYVGGRAAFAMGGARIVGLPVDGDGAIFANAPPGRLAYVTPSHQYPIGVVMPAGRRLDALAWARENDAAIVEDDYDGEFRFDAEAVPSLQALDREGRVIYVGTFSKTLAPGLRVAYLVVPGALLDAFVAARAASSRGVAVPTQCALASFVGDGHFALHVRRMTQLYRERRDVLVESLRTRLGDDLVIEGMATGMHVALRFDDDDRAASAAAAARGVIAPALSAYAIDAAQAPRGLVLGFAGTPAAAIPAAAAVVAESVAALRHRPRVADRP